MPAAPLPPVLEEKLEDLTAEVRRLLVARGCGWVTLTVLAGAAAAIGLDAVLNLPGWVRGLLLVGWVGASAAAAWWLVARPLRQPMTPARLAALVERYFP